MQSFDDLLLEVALGRFGWNCYVFLADCFASEALYQFRIVPENGEGYGNMIMCIVSRTKSMHSQTQGQGGC